MVAEEPAQIPGLLGEEATIGVAGVTVAVTGVRTGFSQGPEIMLLKKKKK